MVQPKLSMRKIREILRLHREQTLSAPMIAASMSCTQSTVSGCLRLEHFRQQAVE